MFGVLIAFKEYDVFDGFLNSPWVGLRNFSDFFKSSSFWLLLRNTLVLNVYMLLFGFPIPIIFAILLNEIRNNFTKRIIQTISYLPHFISTVIVVGIVTELLSPRSGVLAHIIAYITGTEADVYIAKAEYFRSIYVLTEIWRSMGWGSIIFLAALTGIDPSLYEAAVVDGANRWHKIIFITLPSLLPTIAIMFILRVGYMLDVGFEMAYLMQYPMNMEVSDVISTYVYRRGILGSGGMPDFSYATAVGLLQSVVGLTMIIMTNKISRKISEISLW
jgi:putative aldouronate transport system permease protein